MASHTCPGSADTWNVGVGWGLHLSAPRGQCAQHRGVVGSSNGQLGEGGASRSVMSLRLAPGAHWGVAYLCLQPGPRLRPPLAPLHAPPTTPGCSPGSAHHPWLLPRLCPPSRLLPSPRPPHLAPPQALPIVPGSSPSPAHLPRPRPLPQTPPTTPGSLSRPRPLPQAPLQAPPTARSALSRVALLVAVRTQLPCSLLTWLAPGRARRSRRQGLTAWSGGPVTVRSQRPSFRRHAKHRQERML